MPVYKFRNCYLHTAERRVIKDGKYLELTPRTFDVLHLLIEKTGEVVTKDEMLGGVWNGSFVEEGNLPVHVSKLRRLLGERKSERFIETVQGTGYRFTSLVELVTQAEWQANLHVGHQSQRTNLQKANTSAEFIFDSIAALLCCDVSDANLDYPTEGSTENFTNILPEMNNFRCIRQFRIGNKNYLIFRQDENS